MVNHIFSCGQSANCPLSLWRERQQGCVRGRLAGRARGGYSAPVARGRTACVERGQVAAAGQIAGHRGQQRLVYPQPPRQVRGQRVRQNQWLCCSGKIAHAKVGCAAQEVNPCPDAYSVWA
jgi:hypothetical protein